MFTGINHLAALVTAVAALSGAPMLRVGAAAADPSQDDQFLAILDQEDIPAVRNVPSLIATAHKVCRKLDGGMPVADVVDMMVNDAYAIDPPERLYPHDRLARTETRFIIASVEAYCPGDRGKIASVMANPVPGPNSPVHRAAYTRNAAWASESRQPPAGAVAPAGITAPDPPQIPAPPPPTANDLTPPRPVAAPPPPQRPPPPPQLPPPAPAAPEPGSGVGGGGGGAGGGGDGGNGSGGGGGGGGPAQPAPAPDMPPGFVRLAP